jgi:alpha-amylase
MPRSTVIRAIVLLCLSLTLVVAARQNWVAPPQTLAQENNSRPVFVHLFEWKWDDIAQECEAFLAPRGYGAVQISPPAEHIVLPEQGFPWWQRYQPVSYQLISRSGNQAQFTRMIDRCHQVGVRIYADAVINHMAAIAKSVGSAGTSYSRYHYPGLYQPQDFHTCRKSIANYNNRKEVTECELSSLPDLNTELPHIREQIANYLIHLAQLGVDGFRIDAAKHIKTEDIAAILAIVNQAVEPDPYIYQEVLDPGNEAIHKQEYYPNGRVVEAEYGRQVSEKFMDINGSIAQLETLGESWGLMPSEKAIVFIDNHDKQRGHGGGGNYLTYKAGKLYDLANVFMLAFPYGTPQVMSSYAFSNSDQGPPANEKGQTTSVYQNGTAQCFEAWICEHRHPSIASMVQFRNTVPPESPVMHWWSNGQNQIAFSRGTSGFVAINRSPQPLTQIFQTSLAAGTYCNILSNDYHPDQPCPSLVTIDAQGQTTITVAEMSAVAVHTDAMAKP